MTDKSEDTRPDQWSDIRVPDSLSLNGNEVVVPYVILRHGARPPTYQTPGAAGMDLYALPLGGRPIVIKPGQWELIPTGIGVAIPEGHVGYVCPRSGLALRDGLTVLNGPGVIDSDFTGEVGVVLVNHSRFEQRVCVGHRVAQLVVAPIRRARMTEVPSLEKTSRGTGGFGSTGQ